MVKPFIDGCQPAPTISHHKHQSFINYLSTIYQPLSISINNCLLPPPPPSKSPTTVGCAGEVSPAAAACPEASDGSDSLGRRIVVTHNLLSTISSAFFKRRQLRVSRSLCFSCDFLQSDMLFHSVLSQLIHVSILLILLFYSHSVLSATLFTLDVSWSLWHSLHAAHTHTHWQIQIPTGHIAAPHFFEVWRPETPHSELAPQIWLLIGCLAKLSMNLFANTEHGSRFPLYTMGFLVICTICRCSDHQV